MESDLSLSHVWSSALSHTLSEPVVADFGLLVGQYVSSSISLTG